MVVAVKVSNPALQKAVIEKCYYSLHIEKCFNLAVLKPAFALGAPDPELSYCVTVNRLYHNLLINESLYPVNQFSRNSRI